eukprot:GHVU01194316.1.p1 GENE.GHVU01194316.1~~GHVU01194316.1.p1  ORF type:complete len:438 (-),score=35.61 GHVU01194316.1:315-1628(-)
MLPCFGTRAGVHVPRRRLPDLADLEFWVAFWGMHALFRRLRTAAKESQYFVILYPQQMTSLKRLRDSLMKMGSLNVGDPEQRLGTGERVFGRYIVSAVQVVEHAAAVSKTFARTIQMLHPERREHVALGVGIAIAMSAARLDGAIGRGEEAEMPPLEPHVYANMRNDAFRSIVDEQEDRLELHFGPGYEAYKGRLWKDFVDLTPVDAPRQDHWMPRQKGKGRVPLSFEAIWGPLADRFPTLYEFVGGLAAMYTGIALVEGQFSKLAFLRNKWRNQMSVLSLDGIFHCQQLNDVVGDAWHCTNHRQLEGGAGRQEPAGHEHATEDTSDPAVAVAREDVQPQERLAFIPVQRTPVPPGVQLHNVADPGQPVRGSAASRVGGGARNRPAHGHRMASATGIRGGTPPNVGRGGARAVRGNGTTFRSSPIRRNVPQSPRWRS